MICPTCHGTGIVKATEDIAPLVRAMSGGMDLYRGQDGCLYLTSGGGIVSEDVASAAIKQGAIHRKWDGSVEYWEVVK